MATMLLHHKQAVTNLSASGVPNQRLKLTEGAVSDFAARQYSGQEATSHNVRATDYTELAVCRRSLAAIR